MTVRIKAPSIVVALVAVLCLPILINVPARADAGTLICDTPDAGFTTDSCDMFVDEKVSVNENTSVEAPTASQAVQAKAGDTITWTVTVDNDSPGNNLPDGTAIVTDSLPSEASFVSATPSTGTYSNGSWTFGIADNIPATLVVVATAKSTGLFSNTVTLSGYEQPCYYNETCVDPAYNDNNAANNTAYGYVNIPSPTTSTTAATQSTTPSAKVPNTGYGVSSRNVWLGSVAGLLIALPLAGIGYRLRRHVSREQR